MTGLEQAHRRLLSLFSCSVFSLLPKGLSLMSSVMYGMLMARKAWPLAQNMEGGTLQAVFINNIWKFYLWRVILMYDNEAGAGIDTLLNYSILPGSALFICLLCMQ